MPIKLQPVDIIKANLGINADGPVEQYFVKRCAEHMDKYVPYSEGELAYTNRKIAPRKIIYDSPYAHYMYEGRVMGPNIPIKENGIIVRWISPKDKPKHYTGKDIKYKASAGHEYAGPHWARRMWSAEKNDILKEVQDFVNRGGK